MSNDAKALSAGVLAGETRAIARAMSVAEGVADDTYRALMSDVHRHTGNAHVLGLTGVPGSGKSTLVHALAKVLRGADRTVGIVAIDPSSPFSGGAILGDRVRMGDLATDPGVFIRSLATRGALGGLARASLDTVDILDAAGFDVVIIETVGVGQDEVDIAEAAHTVIVVSAPGLGDDVQAIKAGVLEIADIHAVSKCDRDDAFKTVAELQSMLGLGLTGRGGDWQVPVVPTSGETGEGVGELAAAIGTHLDHLEASGERRQRQLRTLEMRVLKTAEDLFRQHLVAADAAPLDALVERVAARELDPAAAARELIQSFKKRP